jgi:hypothetical protein
VAHGIATHVSAIVQPSHAKDGVLEIGPWQKVGEIYT